MKIFTKNKVIIFLLIFFILGISIFVYSKNRENEISKSHRTYKVIKSDFVQKVTVAGQVFAKRRSVINPPFDGYIQKLYVKVGDSVKKGDPIVSIAENLTMKELSFPIRSPFDGKIVLVNHQEGEFVAKGNNSDFIIYIDDLSDFILRPELPEIDLLKVKKGQKVIIKFSAIQKRNYQGVVDEISLAPVEKNDPWRMGGSNSVAYPITIKLLDPDKKIKVGLSSVMDIITYEKKDILSLPHEFIQKEQNNYFVFNLSGVKKQIEVGKQNESVFEVTKGIDEDEVVRQIDFFNGNE